MSEDGGLDEVEEFFLATASCSRRRATVPSSTADRRFLGVQLRLQSPTVRARLPCLESHGELCYDLGREYTTPVNGHARAELE